MCVFYYSLCVEDLGYLLGDGEFWTLVYPSPCENSAYVSIISALLTIFWEEGMKQI